MFTQAILISSVLAVPPPPSRVEVEQSDDSFSVLAYDEQGEVAAEVVEWYDGEKLRIDANFPDGIYLSVAVRGEGDATIESNDPAVAVERIASVEALIADSNDPTEANKWICALEIAAAAIACGTAAGPIGVLGCGIGAGLVACACIPFFDKKIPDDAECFE